MFSNDKMRNCRFDSNNKYCFAFGDFLIDLQSASERKADNIKENYGPETIRIAPLFLISVGIRSKVITKCTFLSEAIGN